MATRVSGAALVNAGELREYVVEELNVSELATAAPDDFSTTTAVPNFAAVGKRLGKDLKAVGAAIKAMTAADIAALQESGSVTLEGHTLSSSDVRAPSPPCPHGYRCCHARIRHACHHARFGCERSEIVLECSGRIICSHVVPFLRSCLCPIEDTAQ